MNRVPTDVVNNLEGTDVLFRKSLGRTGGVNEFGKDENFVTGVEQQRRSPVGVGGCLIVFFVAKHGLLPRSVEQLTMRGVESD